MNACMHARLLHSLGHLPAPGCCCRCRAAPPPAAGALRRGACCVRCRGRSPGPTQTAAGSCRACAREAWRCTAGAAAGLLLAQRDGARALAAVGQAAGAAGPGRAPPLQARPRPPPLPLRRHLRRAGQAQSWGCAGASPQLHHLPTPSSAAPAAGAALRAAECARPPPAPAAAGRLHRSPRSCTATSTLASAQQRPSPATSAPRSRPRAPQPLQLQHHPALPCLASPPTPAR
jgi:hypothetical protein